MKGCVQQNPFRIEKIPSPLGHTQTLDRQISRLNHGGRNRGGSRGPNVFADHKNRYIQKTENEKKKKDEKVVTVFVKFTGVICT